MTDDVTRIRIINNWQLPATNYIAAKMPMTVVHPRPDAETATWARHRNAYPDGVAQYKIPVSIQGGAYPFHFELMQAPAGMSIGQDHADANYGVITWTPSGSGGPYTVEVRVTDQGGATAIATWTVTASVTPFIFVDPNVGSSGDGTKASPIKTLFEIFGPTSGDTTYSGKILYLRDGTHTLLGAEYIDNVQLQNNTKPAVMLGYTGEAAVINCSGSKILVDVQDDVYCGELRMTAARIDVNNAHFYYFNTNHRHDRTTFFEVDFDDIERGLLGSDNPACVAFLNPGNYREYGTIWGCTISDWVSPLFDFYAVRYYVVQNNTVNASSGTVYQGLFLKSDCQYCSVRQNVGLTNSYEYGFVEVLMQAQNITNDEIEICYNKIITSSQRSIVCNWNVAVGANSNPSIYVYRNSFNQQLAGLQYFPYTVDIENNAVSATGKIPTANAWFSPSNNIEQTGILDASGNLTGAGLTYLGTHGAEIA